MNINYYTNNSGKNLILDYINSLSKEEQIDALSVIQCMEEEKFESILFKKWDKKGLSRKSGGGRKWLTISGANCS